MKIFVAVPVYDWKLHSEFVRALLHEQIQAFGNGDEIVFQFLGGNAGITQARNQMATEFMESGFDRLVFLDADITFAPGSIVRLAHHPVDLVGGGYRYKQQHEAYPIRWLEDSAMRGIKLTDDTALLEVDGIPTGFMAISRNVFETMMKAWPERAETMQSGVKAHCYFQMPYVNGALFGEDYFFCKEWRELGGKVFLDPEIHLTHWGFSPVPHAGHIGNWLKARAQEPEAQKEMA